MLTNLKTILDVAYANKYAVGSFNGYNSETFRGIIEAGKETAQIGKVLKVCSMLGLKLGVINE